MARIRHVWARPAGTPTEVPGLVLDWRRREADWEAFVTYVGPRGRVVTEWLPYAELRPIESSAYQGSSYE